MASKKLDDCYFYYYSTCFKGEDCAFRHEESALGCETVCNNWKAGNCKNRRCQFRHMLLKKNRKAIPCFWESQPLGCRKPHCPFLHKNEKPEGSSPVSGNVSGETNQSSSGSTMPKNIPVESSSLLTEGGLRRPNMNQIENDLNFASPPVDPLVVKFEEESDNELDIPSPCKSVAVQSQKQSWVKTLEEIRLEKIQKLSAAFYNFTAGIEDQEPEDVMMGIINTAIVKDLDVLTMPKTNNRSLVKSTANKRKSSEDGSLGFRVMTLDEIRQKRQKRNQVQEPDSTSESDRLGPSGLSGEEDKFGDKTPASSTSSDIHQGSTNDPLRSSIESADVDVPEKKPSQSSMEDVNVPEVKNPNVMMVEKFTDGTNGVDPQKMKPIKMSSPLHESIECPSIDVLHTPKPIKILQKVHMKDENVDDSQNFKVISPQKPIKIFRPQKLHQCTEDATVDDPQKLKAISPQKPIKIFRPQKLHQCTEDANVDDPQKLKAISPQKSIMITSLQKVHQCAEDTNVDDPQKLTSISPLQQSTDDVDVPQKKKPIRLKRCMRRDTQEELDKLDNYAKRPKTTEDNQTSDTPEESDKLANSAKRFKNAEDVQPSISLNSSRLDDGDQSNILEINLNPGEMDTDDILNGIDELLGN